MRYFFIYLSAVMLNAEVKSNPMEYSSKKVLQTAFISINEVAPMEFAGFGEKINDQIERLSLSLYNHDSLNKKEATDLAVLCEKILVEKINTSKELRPYLKSYPATSEHAQIIIFFDEDKIQEPNPFYSISVAGNEIQYLYKKTIR